MARYVWLFIFVISGIVNAQPAVEWERNDVNLNLRWGHCVVQTGDGGYLIGGSSMISPPGIILRLSPIGDIVSQQHYSEMSSVRSVVPTRDGGFVWANYWGLNIMKTDAEGAVLWSHQWQPEIPSDSTWYTYGNMQPVADGGFILSGGCYNWYEAWPRHGRIYLMKFAENGDSLWLRTYRSEINCDSARVLPASDGGFLLLGHTRQQQIGDTVHAIASKVDADGNLIWSRVYGDGGALYTGKAMSDGGFLLAGEHFQTTYPRYLVLIRTDAVGDTLWTREIREGQHLTPLRMMTTWDGAAVLAGAQWDGGASESQLWLGKINDNGDLLWSSRFPHVPYEWTVALIQTADGGYLATSSGYPSTNYGSYAVKLASETPPGRMALNHTSLSFIMHQQDDSVSMPLIVQSTGTHPLRIASLATTASWYTVSAGGPFWLDPGTDTTIWVTCHRQTGPGDLSGTLWILSNDSLPGNGAHRIRLEVNQIGGSDSEPSELPTRFQLYPNYPNPFNPSTTIAFDLPKTEFVSLKVFDLLGREVAVLNHGVIAAGHHSLSFDGSALASGIYFYRIQAGSFSANQKLMLLK
jgi:hypothetical protein